MSDVLLLGLGNILLGDDGLGSWFAQTFAQRYTMPPQLELVDGGTLGLELLGLFGGRRAVIVVDAIATGRPPGTVVRLESATLHPAVSLKLSTHDVGLADLLAAAVLLECLPAVVVACGIEPAEIAPRLGLSGLVRAALPALDALVAGELARLDCASLPREAVAPAAFVCG